MAARNREGFRSIISYGDVLDGNGRGCRSSRPCSPRFSSVERERRRGRASDEPGRGKKGRKAVAKKAKKRGGWNRGGDGDLSRGGGAI